MASRKWIIYMVNALSPYFCDTTYNSDFLLVVGCGCLLIFRCSYNGIAVRWWQHSAKLFYSLSSHVSALLLIVMSLFANFISFFANLRRKKDTHTQWKKTLYITNLMVSMHRRTCYRFNKMPSLSSDVLWPIVIRASTYFRFYLFCECKCVSVYLYRSRRLKRKKWKERKTPPYWVSANNTKNNK